MMKKVLTACVLALLVAATGVALSLPTRSVQPLQWQDLKTHCTAFSINEKDHLWLTDRHCIVMEPDEDTGEVEIKTAYLGGKPAEVVHISSDLLDVLVLKAAISAPAYHLHRTAPTLDDKIEIFGFAYGLSPMSYWRGRIANLRVNIAQRDPSAPAWYQTLYDCHAAPGNSGSPVLADGKVIGILQLGWQAGFTSGLPWDLLVREVGQYFE